MIDAVKWIPAGALYQVRGGPLDQPFLMPDYFDAARAALTRAFPGGPRRHRINCSARCSASLGVMNQFSQGDDTFENPRDSLGALIKLLPAPRTGNLSLSQKLDRVFGDNEAIKCALAANLSYFHDDPATLWWIYFAMAQGSYLQSGGRYVQGGSQRLSSALARAIKVAGGDVLLRRVVSRHSARAMARQIRHPHRQGRQRSAGPCNARRIIGNAAPAALGTADAGGRRGTTEPRLCAAARHRSRCSR